jgi:predicted ribosome quality control (RQC) complex YloA/Tae2 family protein
VASVERPDNERVVIIRLRGESELEGSTRFSLVVQLTGRSSNFFLLDRDDRIMDSLKTGNGPGQETGETYKVPASSPDQRREQSSFDKGKKDSISDALDEFYRAKEEEERRNSAFRSAESTLRRDLKKKRRLRKALLKDLEDHGDENQWKRLGELLLANTANAKRVEGGFLVNDYYSEDAREIEIPADARHTVAESAERYFRKYTKARNARTAIAERLEMVEEEISGIESRLKDLVRAFSEGDEEAFETLAPDKAKPQQQAKIRSEKGEPQGVRKFVSRDGFEILVGKRSKDNDYLTFRIARSLDTWMHAADYPGSHVVVRNPQRKELPHSTLIEAAQLAAFYSKARGESKAAVHYTLRKFVHKPKGAKPGLVSLADFKTLMVEPGIPDGTGD